MKAQVELPPIIVHRQTMRVIDGMHRLRAALLAERETIAVRFFDGSVEDSFIQAVVANSKHGLPLSLADRKAAAARIVSSHPHCSDRSIAAITGLAPKTVGVIRQLDDAGAATVTRIGRDGRVRSLNTVERRRVASEMITRRPDVSLRTVAREAGISPATARDVRDKMRAEGRSQRSDGTFQSPSQKDQGPERPDRENDRSRRSGIRDKTAVLGGLMRDPSLRFTESGRALLRWLVSRTGGPEGWSEFVGTIPPHCLYQLADLARACATEWLQLADDLEQRTGKTEPMGSVGRCATE
ncbi:MAG: ParB-like nuclease domain-containing protein [Micromonosporaceae bacterium]|nr:ParB-like nuclease domain-containing protein [Micromonosporaceae bacterium]